MSLAEDDWSMDSEGSRREMFNQVVFQRRSISLVYISR